MSGRVFCGILSCLQRNSSLCSFDASHNGLKHSPQVKESLRQFLRLNRGMRTFDLSHNKFTADTLNAIHLGLLENDGNLRTILVLIFFTLLLYLILLHLSLLLMLIVVYQWC